MKLFLKALNKEGLEARKAGNPPLNKLPYFKKCKTQKIKSAEHFYENSFSIPTFTFERKEILDLYIKGIKKVCKHFYK